MKLVKLQTLSTSANLNGKIIEFDSCGSSYTVDYQMVHIDIVMFKQI